MTKFTWLLSSAAVATVLSSCAPTPIQHGNLVSDDKLAYLKVGHHTKSDIAELLGPPSSSGVFDGTTWYYAGMSGEKLAFFKPDVTAEKTIKLVFDETGTLTRIVEYDPADKDESKPNSRATVTRGHDETILQQIFGNFGRRYQQENKK